MRWSWTRAARAGRRTLAVLDSIPVRRKKSLTIFHTLGNLVFQHFVYTLNSGGNATLPAAETTMHNYKSPFARIIGRDTWCVPAAIAAVTGWSTDLIRCLIIGIEQAHSPSWTGVTCHTAALVLKALGIEGAVKYVAPKFEHGVQVQDRPTLTQWCREHQQGYFLVAAGGHMITVRNGMVIDNGSWTLERGMHWDRAGGIPVHYTDLPQGKRARVTFTVQIPDEDWHERQDDIQPPRWAIAASKELQDQRIEHGSRATISAGWIQRLKELDERRIEDERKLAAAAARKRADDLRREIEGACAPAPAPAVKICSRCNCGTKTLRRDLCLRCYHTAKRNWEFGGVECCVDDCSAIAEAKGFCRNHWKRSKCS